MCSNALIGAASKRGGSEGGEADSSRGQCGPVPRPSNPGDHDAGGVSHLPRSEGPKQAFWAPKEKQGGWADFGGLWYYTCFCFNSHPFEGCIDMY